RAPARREIDRAEACCEDDPPENRHHPGDHEDDDADPRDVDAGPTGGLRVAADRVDVAAEGRATRDVPPEDHEPDDEQAREGDPTRVVTDSDDAEADGRKYGHSEHDQRDVAG